MSGSEAQEKPRKSRLRPFLTTAVVIVLALLSISLVVQIPAVQRWGITQLSKYMSRETGSEVTVKGFSLNFLSQLSLQGVYISQYEAPTDTLIYAGEIGLKFSRIWKLFGKSPEIRQVSLHNARIFVTDTPIMLFKSRQKTNRSTGIVIDKSRIFLENVQLELNRSGQKMLMHFQLPEGLVRVEKLDTELRNIDVGLIDLRDPTVEFLKKDVVETGPQFIVTSDSSEKRPFDWSFQIGDIYLSEGTFALKGGLEEGTLNVVNYNDLYVDSVTAELTGVRFANNSITGTLHEMTFREHSGFVMEQIGARNFEVTSEGIGFGSLEIRTPESIIADTLHIGFAKGEEAGDSPDIYMRFQDSYVAVSDLMHTIPGIRNSEVFRKNRDQKLHISGVISGTPNRLRGDSLEVQLGDMVFRGRFRSRNLSTPGQQVLNLVVDNARFRAKDLEKHIPGVRVQDQFNRLGNIQFQGRFDGFFSDFVAYGQLRTDLGVADVDINLETSTALARYSGALNLSNFNLKKWTGSDDFGFVSARLNLNDGSGLTAETASAHIAGTINKFQYKGYTYAGVRIDGRLNKNYFNGILKANDPNIDLLFEGDVTLEDGVPEFDFAADVRYLDLKALNLSKDTFRLAGVINAQGKGKELNTLEGRIIASNIALIRGANAEYILDTAYIDIVRSEDGHREIKVTSDYVDGWINGDFELRTLYPSVARFIEESYPQYFDSIPYRRDLAYARPSMQFEVVLNRPEDWRGLLGLRDLSFSDLHTRGSINLDADSVMIYVDAPDIHYGHLNVYRPVAQFSSIGGEASANVNIIAIDIDEKYFFDEVSASIRTLSDGFAWTLAADDLLEELNTLDITGRFQIDSQRAYSLVLDPRIIEIWDQQWELRSGNAIRWGKDYVDLKNVVFQHEDQRIMIDDLDRRGITLETQAFDLGIIDVIWDYDKLDFAGPYRLRAGIRDIFDKSDVYLEVDVPNLNVNNDDYGALSVSARMPKAGDPVSVELQLDKDGVHALGQGKYYPPLEQVPGDLRNTLDARIDLDTFPIRFLEYYLLESVNNTTGSIVGHLGIKGPLSKVTMDGDAVVYDGATTVTYLGTRYRVGTENIGISESRIDMTGLKLFDEEGNTADVYGGLTHRTFGKWGLDTRIISPRLMTLNTTRADNETYYGRGYGSVDAIFEGMFDRPTITVSGVTGTGTNVIINLVEAAASDRSDFIRFRNEEEVIAASLTKRTNITGLNFEMNLTATPDAKVEIKLEENPPESIIGTGNGDMQMSISRTGDFTMYGIYEIEEGDYLFKSFVIINKPFILRRGGTIRWSGDPYNADINIEADYIGLRASLSTFLAEYLVNAPQTTRDEATRKQDVQLKLLLTGTLLEPEINFDLSFPNLTGELAGYADTKLRVLKANQNALNEQVFGLLWAGSFLPSNVLQSNSGLAIAEQGIYNSLSEFLSGQVSTLFSSVISQWVEDVDFISGIDFDVGYSRVSEFDNAALGGASSGYEEWEVRVKNRLLNDRVIIDAGANYGTGTAIGAGEYLVGDYALEYLLTQDGRLKIRFYYRNDPQSIEGRKDKYGIGLAWRREFDTFDEWLKGLKKESKGIRNEIDDKNLNE